MVLYLQWWLEYLLYRIYSMYNLASYPLSPLPWYIWNFFLNRQYSWMFVEWIDKYELILWNSLEFKLSTARRMSKSIPGYTIWRLGLWLAVPVICCICSVITCSVWNPNWWFAITYVTHWWTIHRWIRRSFLNMLAVDKMREMRLKDTG